MYGLVIPLLIEAAIQTLKRGSVMDLDQVRSQVRLVVNGGSTSVLTECVVVAIWLVIILYIRWRNTKPCHAKCDSCSKSTETLGTAVQSGNQNVMRFHLAQLEESCVELDTASCDVVMQACNKLNELDRGSRWLGIMHESSIQATTSIYSTYLELCMKEQDIEVGNACLVQMFKYASSAKNQAAVRRAAHQCAKKSHLPHTRRMVQAMRLAGMPPDAALYLALISGCARFSHVLDADIWLKEMTNESYGLKVSTCSEMIRACSRVVDPARAEMWLQKLLECEDEATRTDEKRTPRKEFTQKNQCHSIVISTYARAGNFLDAQRCLQWMQDGGCVPDLFDWNNVLSICCKTGNLAAARQCIENMIRSGLTPDTYSYNNILNACAKLGDMDTLGEWIDRMAESGVHADVVMCNTILNACVKASQLTRATELFEKMRHPNSNPRANEISFAIIARLHAEQGEWQTVEKLMDEMSACGFMMNAHHYRALLLAYGVARPRQSKRAEEALLRGQSRGIEINRPMQLALAQAVGWPRCNQLLGRRIR